MSSKALIACFASSIRESPDTPEASFMLPETSSTISRFVSISTAVTERSDAMAVGTSSTMLTTRLPVVLLPRVSVA
ncbi:hypothetical protein D3C84_1131590 [compost metagenome]